MGVRESHSLRERTQVEEKIREGSNEISFVYVECDGPLRFPNGDNSKKLGCIYGFESHNIRS